MVPTVKECDDRYLLRVIGGHARNVRLDIPINEGLIIPVLSLCSVCRTPIEPQWSLCYACKDQEKKFPGELANIVIPLTYAVRDYAPLRQLYSDLYNYKEDLGSRGAMTRLTVLLELFVRRHLKCLEIMAGAPVTAVIPVPSGRNRQNHPIYQIAKSVFEVPVIDASYVGIVRSGRSSRIMPDDFSISVPLSGHVVIFEDTWVQGNNAQSVAIQAKRAGADYVSIVVLARMLDYGFSVSKGLVDTWPADARWDIDVCPIAGGACP